MLLSRSRELIQSGDVSGSLKYKIMSNATAAKRCNTDFVTWCLCQKLHKCSRVTVKIDNDAGVRAILIYSLILASSLAFQVSGEDNFQRDHKTYS